VLDTPTKEHADRIINLWALSKSDQSKFSMALEAHIREISGLLGGDGMADFAAMDNETYKGKNRRLYKYVEGKSGKLVPVYDSALADKFVSAFGVASLSVKKAGTPDLYYHDNRRYLIDRIVKFDELAGSLDEIDRMIILHRYLNFGSSAKELADKVDCSYAKMKRAIKKARARAMKAMQVH